MYKILHILTDTNIGGAGKYLINYLKSFDRRAFDIRVVLPRGSLLIPEVLATGTCVIEADDIAERSFSPKGIRSLREIIRRESPDIVHTHGSFSGRIAGRLSGCKVIYTRHSAFPVPNYLQKGPGHWLNGLVNGFFADQIIAVSPATAENLTDSGISAKKITIMMNGVEPLQLSSPAERTALRQKLWIPDGVFTAGILARLEPYKGHMVLLDAAKELAQEGRDFRILIAGSGSEEEFIRSRIQELGLENHVIMLGFVSQVSHLLSILDIQLNCSYESETSSLSIIEGMSIGVPSIASNCSGNPWLVEDSITGLLFENKNAQDLAGKIRVLMDEPATLRSMRRCALEAYHSRFTGEIFAKNIEKVYTKTLYRK